MAESKQTTQSHTEVPAAAHGHFPPFQKDTIASQLLWFVITFALLYLMVAKLALPRVSGIIEGRRGRIAGDLATASRLKEEADAAILAYEKALTEARGRAQTLANETHEKLNAEAEKDRKTLEGRLSAQLAEAERKIAATKAAAMANVRTIAGEAASAIVLQLTGTSPSETIVASAVDDVLKR